MKVKKIIVCLLGVIFVSSCSTPSFMCIPSARKAKVRDVFLDKYYIPSHKINTEDRYCLFYQKWANVKKSIDLKFEKEIPEILKGFGINFIEEENVPTVQDKKTDIFLAEISERERKNNYKNCDYIIYYDTYRIEVGKNNICSSSLGIKIKVFDIKANKEIAYYAINKGVYQESKQSEFTEILMNKWWEYQNTPNTKKQTTFECTSSGCRTIKCIGDKCEIEE